MFNGVEVLLSQRSMGQGQGYIAVGVARVLPRLEHVDDSNCSIEPGLLSFRCPHGLHYYWLGVDTGTCNCIQDPGSRCQWGGLD